MSSNHKGVAAGLTSPVPFLETSHLAVEHEDLRRASDAEACGEELDLNASKGRDKNAPNPIAEQSRIAAGTKGLRELTT